MYRQNADIILASGSPRRKEMFETLGLRFAIHPARCDESLLPSEKPEEYVRRLSFVKAAEVAARSPKEAWVIGADTTVVLNGRIYGKPETRQEAVEMLATLQGCTHAVVGAFAILNAGSGVEYAEVHTTKVVMRAVSTAELDAYVRTGEPMDKAGAYAIQGIAGVFVTSIEGSFSNVIGLNIEALVSRLKKHGVLSE